MSARIAAYVLVGLAWTGILGGRAAVSAGDGEAPPFPSSDAESWIGPPQSFPALRGKVVLIDVWTFG